MDMIWKEIQKGAEELGRHYVLEFKRKFQLHPFENAQDDDLECLRWLYKQHGLETSKKLISTFLEMEDEWFTKMGHSLSQLQKNIVRVIETQGKKSGRRHSHLKTTEGMLACDSCWKHFRAFHPIDINWNNVMVRCPNCLSTNRPFKYPTKEEYEHLAVLGAPAYERIFVEKLPYPRPDLDYELP